MGIPSARRAVKGGLAAFEPLVGVRSSAVYGNIESVDSAAECPAEALVGWRFRTWHKSRRLHRYGAGKLGVSRGKRRDPGFLVLSASSPPPRYPPQKGPRVPL